MLESIYYVTGNIYYLVGLIIFVLSLFNIFSFYKIQEIKKWILSFKKISGKDPGDSDFKNKNDIKLVLSYSSIITLEFIWMVLGILTNSWYIFIGVILFSYLFNTFVNIIKIDIIQKYLGILIYLLRSAVILALIVNHFHLHINWILYLSNLFYL